MDLPVHDQLGVGGGKPRQNPLGCRDGRVGRVLDADEQLHGSVVVLGQEARQILLEMRLQAMQRLDHRRRRVSPGGRTRRGELAADNLGRRHGVGDADAGDGEDDGGDGVRDADHWPPVP